MKSSYGAGTTRCGWPPRSRAGGPGALVLAVVELVQERAAELVQQVGDRQSRPRSVCASMRSATFSSTSRSSSTRRRMPGRCTLTTTGRPPRSVARCTCPSDAAASVCSSNSSNSRDSRTPSSSSIVSRATCAGNGSISSWSRPASEDGGQEVRARGEQLPELDEGRAQPLELGRQLVTLSPRGDDIGAAGGLVRQCRVEAGLPTRSERPYFTSNRTRSA